MKTYLASHIGPALAVLFCGVAAWAVTLVKWESVRDLVPFAFLVVVLALGLAFGGTVGILGSIVAAVVFAHSLYKPLGSLRIADPQDPLDEKQACPSTSTRFCSNCSPYSSGRRSSPNCSNSCRCRRCWAKFLPASSWVRMPPG